MRLEHLESMAVRMHARAWKPGMGATLLAMAVPAYGATAFDPATWSWNEMLLAGALALLAVATAARLWRSDEWSAVADTPDLRWWRDEGDRHDGAMS